jgi:hypothetical protein
MMFDMIDISTSADGDRLIVELDPNEPVGLAELGQSFQALSNIYTRSFGEETGAKLYITRIESGSVVAELAPYATILGAIVATMDSSMIIADFSRRVGQGIQAFAGVETGAKHTAIATASAEADAEDLKAFTSPLLGKQGAKLGIKRARYTSRTGAREVTAEYEFQEPQLNRAALNIDRFLELSPEATLPAKPSYEQFHRKLLVVSQASRLPGKISGRTGDRGEVPDMLPATELPLHFAKSINDIKDKMVRSSAVNPLHEHAFIVSGYLVSEGPKPKSYLVTEVHDVVDL